MAEIIEPTALRGTKLDDLVATVDHTGIPIGRYPTTLHLEDRADGLHWSVSPPGSRSDIQGSRDETATITADEFRGVTYFVRDTGRADVGGERRGCAVDVRGLAAR
jgi:hypothetical protein